MTMCTSNDRAKNFSAMTKVLLPILLVIGLAGCCWLQAIAHYDEVAYTTAGEIKAQSLALVERATEPYSEHAAEVTSLKADIDETLSYERQRCKNKLTVQQWEIIANPNGHSLGGLLQRWEKEGSLDSTFISLAATEISKHFDEVLSLETAKTRG
ncbi:MAG: hypothetical protein PHI18_06300 [bacterium]|nr:hypothetical protein [bacterium]